MHLIHTLSYQAKRNPHWEETQANTLNWLRLTGAFQGHEQFLVGISEVGRLVGYAYPDADKDSLQLISDWSTLFFLLDDIVESIPSPALVATHNQKVIKALDGELVSPYGGLHLALRNLGDRLRLAGGRVWMKQFTDHVIDWLSGHIWEAQNRASHRTPSEREYMLMRQHTIGMRHEFALSELFRGPLPFATRESLRFQRVTALASSQIALANDLFTLDKEQTQGDVHNIVFSMMVSRCLTKEAAIEHAVQLHNVLAREFLQESRALQTSRLMKYVIDLKSWISGHLQWGLDNRRYSSRHVGIQPIE